MGRSIEVGIVRFKFSRPILTGEASLARGFFGKLFSDKVLSHHHLLDEGRLLYRYPLVQYKALWGELLVIGIEEGVELIGHFAHLESIMFDSEELTVLEAHFQHYNEELGAFGQQMKYQFLTPWLALNEENVKVYYRYRSSFKKIQELLSRILVGNILSMTKGLNYTVKDRIYAEVKVKECRCSLKKNPMLGFVGEFTINFKLPDYIGLGKSVSRGFGTIIKRGE
jgi:hypothetical protein